MQRELSAQYVERQSAEVWGWLMLAQTLGSLGQYEQALGPLRSARVLARGSALAEVWLQWGRLCEARGANALAVRWYRKALAAQVTSRSLGMLAAALVRQGERAEAKRLYQRALRRAEPGAVEACCQLGSLYRAEGKYREALSCFEAALASEPRLPSAQLARRDVLAVLQGAELALAALSAERGRSLLLQAKERSQPALQRELGQVYVQVHGQDFRGWLLLADALAALGCYAEASTVWRRAVRLAPSAARPQIWIFWGLMCVEQGALALAVRHYRKALAVQVKSEWLILLGAALARQGQHAAARRCQRRALARREPGAEEACYQLGLVYRAERNYAAALSCLEEASQRRYEPARVAREDVRRAARARSLAAGVVVASRS